ncbi:MAG TPA: hypothetical protein VN043_17940 [Rhodanobacter sp.]|nr:hypothetical protein [Rhodanobacter sp.]
MSPHVENRLHELELLTRSYARYSRSAGGMSSVLGGVLCLVAYLGGPLLPEAPPMRALLIAIPALWLLAKSWMVRSYYQRMGHVEQQETPQERRMHRGCVAVALLVAVIVTTSIGIGAHPHVWSLSAGMLGYLALVWLLVLATWRWLRSPLDFIVGTFLFCQAAMISAGAFYPLIGTTHTREATLMSLVALMFPLAALAMIARGIAEHRQFRELRQRLEQLRGALAGEA